ncbi:MAG TPA: glycosyltransferase family A protein [Rhizobiaceae bacterium]|nr:glycosyltransferase family A protein [Rhizobiaceae bacterium]
MPGVASTGPVSVSAVIPCHGRQERLLAAIESAHQSGVDEILVVDDGTPTPLEAPQDGRVRLLRLPENKGAAAARNAGVAAARGRWIAFLDSDDRWLVGKIDVQLAFLAARPGLAGVTCGFRLDRDGRATDYLPDNEALDFDRALTGGRFGIGSTLMVRRDLFLGSGGFDETLGRHEDWEWLLRFTSRHELGIARAVMAEVSLGSRPDPDAVLAALRCIEAAQLPHLDFGRGRRLRAALALERAALARWGGRHLDVATELSRAALWRPLWTLNALWRRAAHGEIP